jgi:ribosomal protein L20
MEDICFREIQLTTAHYIAKKRKTKKDIRKKWRQRIEVACMPQTHKPFAYR